MACKLIQSIIEEATKSNEIELILDNKRIKFKNSDDEIEVSTYDN